MLYRKILFDTYEPLATNLVIDDVHSAVFVNRVIRQMHEHVWNIVTGRFLVFARSKPENATFRTFQSEKNFEKQTTNIYSIYYIF